MTARQSPLLISFLTTRSAFQFSSGLNWIRWWVLELRNNGFLEGSLWLLFCHLITSFHTFFFLVRCFGCWWVLSSTAKIAEDLLVVRSFGGWLLHTLVVYYAWQHLCSVFHRILLVALYLQDSMGLTWLGYLLHAMATTHHCWLFPVCFSHFWDQPLCALLRPRAQQGISNPGDVLGQRCQAGHPGPSSPHEASPGRAQASQIRHAALYKHCARPSNTFSSASSQRLSSLMRPSWCIKLVN